jgi:ribonuclease P protein component
MREWALRKRAQFQNVYKFGIGWRNRFVIVKAVANDLEFSRYGFSVTKAIGKAVVRNKIRRRLKEIMRTTPLKSGWDLVVIARPESVEADFKQLEKSVRMLLLRADLLVDKNETVSNRVN